MMADHPSVRNSTVSDEPVRRPRRFDPDRKNRILEATLVVMARHGARGTTHRLVAAEADVPLGSMTYHFTDLEDLLAQAWALLIERLSTAYAAHFAKVTTRAQLVDAVVSLVETDAGGSPDDWAAAYALYAAALRDTDLRETTEAWMRGSRAVLERLVDPITARGIDALIEGLLLHTMVSTDPLPTAQTRRLVARMVDGAT
jgi:TetR/AcrR family transcriptional regulator, regulator of biofilm formation and stress response